MNASFKHKIAIGLTSALIGAWATSAHAATQIQWWHAMGGELGKRVNELAAGFNASQSEYVVKPVYKGNYTDTMTAGVAAFRAGNPPDILQVFEVGTASMMAAKGAIYPVYKLMQDEKIPFNENRYISAVTGYYTTTDGKMLSMPFNSSTPVLFWNKAVFTKAGLTRAPRTWKEMGEYSQKIVSSGAASCGFTVGWQSWVMLENFGAWNNLPFATQSNGFGGLDTKLVFNGPTQIKAIQQLADWQKDKIFRYGGRRSNANPLFAQGKCAMLLNSSASYGSLKASTKFDFGTSQLPYWAAAKGAPQNSIIGGASLWVLKGKPKKDYKGVAEFLNYLSDPFVQTFWHENTGYVPITKAAYQLTKDTGYYKTFKGRDVPIEQMNGKKPTANSKGLRLGNFVQIRDIINEELEAVWAHKKTAKQALNEAVRRGNVLLRKFEKANR